MLCTPFTQWFCWSLSLLNGYNWGYTPFSDIPTLCHISRLILGKKNRLRWFHQAMSSNIYMLVGGLEHEFYFPFHIWDVILPIDSYFSRWLKPPTRHAWVFEFHGHYIYIHIYIYIPWPVSYSKHPGSSRLFAWPWPTHLPKWGPSLGVRQSVGRSQSWLAPNGYLYNPFLW